MSNDLHKKHRERVKKDFLEHGLPDDIPSHKILEFLLFYSIPRKDTNEIAHLLLMEFGSLAGVLEAEISELMKVKGVGENTAILLKLMLPLLKKYQNDKSNVKPKFKDSDSVCKYLINKYFGCKVEVFTVMSFSSDGKLIACDKISEGDVTSVGVSIRTIVQVVLKRNAACVVLAHNHLSEDALPSDADVEMTKVLRTTLERMGVSLIDHVIVVTGDAISMIQTPKYRKIFL